MTEIERRLLIAVAAAMCAVMADKKAKAIEADPIAAVGIRYTIHSLLMAMTHICSENDLANVFTEQQMKDLVS